MLTVGADEKLINKVFLQPFVSRICSSHQFAEVLRFQFFSFLFFINMQLTFLPCTVLLFYYIYVTWWFESQKCMNKPIYLSTLKATVAWLKICDCFARNLTCESGLFAHILMCLSFTDWCSTHSRAHIGISEEINLSD